MRVHGPDAGDDPGRGLDRAYLRQHPAQVPLLIAHQRIRSVRVRGGDLCTAERLTLDDGTSLFAKSLPGAPGGLFASEARGLAWLASAPGGPPVPDVVAVTDELLLLDWVEPGEPAPTSAEQLGRALARMHAAGAPGFGASWPGHLGRLDLDNAGAPDWPTFYAQGRVAPLLARAADAGNMAPDDVHAVERVLTRLAEVAGPAEAPARLHGDLWWGNVHHGADGRAWLVDPAAHGGHRETDLAMLRLFGAPLLDRVLGAYVEMSPLADGADERVPIHQLHPLLAHAVLFGGAYGAMAGDAARRCP
jgi:fructosamine-3-kinase